MKADSGSSAGQIETMRFALFNPVRSDPSHLEIRHGEDLFKVLLRRNAKARRVTLRVSSATGEIVMTMPQKASLATASRFAEAHGGWIAARVQRLPDRVAFIAGVVIPVRGIPHRIVRKTSQQLLPVGPGENTDGEKVLVVGGDEAHTTRRVKELLQKEARRDLEAAVSHYTGKLGVRAQKISLKDTRSRWGSCSSTGSLSFSWRLIFAPPEVLDYLAAHEVAHLVEMNHSNRFWRTVHDICPHVESAEKWLKRNGSSLHRYG